MYTPPVYKVPDTETCHALIRELRFAILFSQSNEGPKATHLAGPHGHVSVNWYEGQQTFPTWISGAVHDAPLNGPWRMEKVDLARTERLFRMIVGLSIEIETVEGKLNFSQPPSPGRPTRSGHQASRQT